MPRDAASAAASPSRSTESWNCPGIEAISLLSPRPWWANSG